MAERGRCMVRFADDFVILCRTREEADAALAEVRAWVGENGLALHPEKTHDGDCRRLGQGFEFLGYRFEAGQRHVRQKSLNKFKDSIREDAAHTGRQPRLRRGGSQPAVARLVRLLQTYPSHHLRQARRVCQAAAARRPAQAGKAPRAGRLPRRPSTLAKCLLRGSRAVRASHGLVIGETVSMKKPPTGEPYAGKPPVRFGGRGRRKPIPTPISSSLTFTAVCVPGLFLIKNADFWGRAHLSRYGRLLVDREASSWRNQVSSRAHIYEASAKGGKTAPLRGPDLKAPGFAGGYLPGKPDRRRRAESEMIFGPTGFPSAQPLRFWKADCHGSRAAAVEGHKWFLCPCRTRARRLYKTPRPLAKAVLDGDGGGFRAFRSPLSEAVDQTAWRALDDPDAQAQPDRDLDAGAFRPPDPDRPLDPRPARRRARSGRGSADLPRQRRQLPQGRSAAQNSEPGPRQRAGDGGGRVVAFAAPVARAAVFAPAGRRVRPGDAARGRSRR